ncbi:MAG: GNAT family N-acetyltransferase [Pseudomonadota bacterium]
MTAGVYLEDDVSLESVMPLCQAVFGDDFSRTYLAERLDSMTDVSLIVAQVEDEPAGFKLGYRFSGAVYYSWLGGVVPSARRMGLAGQLMAAQHEWAQANHYQQIETRVRSNNQAMLIVNLKAGFEVVGLDRGRGDTFNLLLRKDLGTLD